MRTGCRYPACLGLGNDLAVTRSADYRRRERAASLPIAPGRLRLPRSQSRSYRREPVCQSRKWQIVVAHKIIELDSGRITILNRARWQHKGFSAGTKASGAQKKAPDVDGRKAISPGEYFD